MLPNGWVRQHFQGSPALWMTFDQIGWLKDEDDLTSSSSSSSSSSSQSSQSSIINKFHNFMTSRLMIRGNHGTIQQKWDMIQWTSRLFGKISTSSNSLKLLITGRSILWTSKPLDCRHKVLSFWVDGSVTMSAASDWLLVVAKLGLQYLLSAFRCAWFFKDWTVEDPICRLILIHSWF